MTTATLLGSLASSASAERTSTGRDAQPVAARPAEPSTLAGRRPAFSDWRTGDVHVHAAGDSGLGGHSRCGGLDNDECATKLVGQSLDRAEANGLDWLVFTEHVPWLGLYRRTFCPTPWTCETVTNPLRWEKGQAEDQFDAIKAALESAARDRRTVRPLLGEELGTAAAVCHAPGTTKAGHFGVYYTPEMVSNGQLDCNEAEYLRNVDDAGAGGAINHPDNDDGGSDWYCWYQGDGRSNGDDCGNGATEFGNAPARGGPDSSPAWYGIEIVNDNNVPTERTVDHYDNVLQRGWRVGVTGGSDSHTATRGSLGANQEAGNDGKIGLTGRTFAFLPDSVQPSSSYTASEFADPVRRALRAGRTIASNGPEAIPQAEGYFPGDVGQFAGSSLDVRLDWSTSDFTVVDGNGEVEPGEPVPVKHVEHDPDRLVFVVGRIDTSCTDRVRPCGDVEREIYTPTSADIARGYAEVTIPIDASWRDVYVRTEYLQSHVADNSTFPDGDEYRYVAFSSPIYLRRGTGGPPPAEGCRANILGRNDDSSTSSVELPFPVNFYGTAYTHAFVNNNGNVTFLNSLSTYTPFNINASTPPIIAPFLADVDTRNGGSKEVTYGATTVDGRPAFCVYWEDVGYYSGHADKLNTFRLYLIDRSDVRGGDFDIVFDYDTLTWEAGDASGGAGGFGGQSAGAGFSAGTGQPDAFFQLPGSLQNGAFLDSSATGLANTSSNTLETGVHRFEIRNGDTAGTLRLLGTVVDPDGDPVSDSAVEVCPEDQTRCVFVTTTNRDGQFAATGLAAGQYRVRAMPPSRLPRLLPGVVHDIDVQPGPSPSVVVQLPEVGFPPDGTIIGAWDGSGSPSLRMGVAVPFVIEGCAGGASLDIYSGASILREGIALTEGPGGHYAASLAPFTSPGALRFVVSFACGQSSAFDVYIDPSGFVRDTQGQPIEGAVVTLLRSDTESGEFTTVPDGDALMSPSNRANPDSTATDGHFGWDVIAGFYRVRAQANGCHAPGQPDVASVETPVLEIPPPVTDIELVLDCTPPTNPPLTLFVDASDGTLGAPFTFSTTCRTGDVENALPDASAETGASALLGTPAVGSLCTVTMHPTAGWHSAMGTDSVDVEVSGTRSEIHFAVARDGAPGALTITAAAGAAGMPVVAVPVDVACAISDDRSVAVDLGSVVTVPGLADGETCDVTVRPPNSLRTVEPSATQVVTIANPETNATFTLVPNSAPDAADDVATTGMATAVTIDVLANDSDPDGEPVRVISQQPADHGVVTCSETSCRYTPNAGFKGTDMFSYSVADLTGATATADVEVKVVRTDPVPECRVDDGLVAISPVTKTTPTAKKTKLTFSGKLVDCEHFDGVPSKYPISSGNFTATLQVPVGATCAVLRSGPPTNTKFSVTWKGINPKNGKLAGAAPTDSTQIASFVENADPRGFRATSATLAGKSSAFRGDSLELAVVIDESAAAIQAACSSKSGLKQLHFDGARGPSTMTVEPD